jgi:hypothetical protein
MIKLELNFHPKEIYFPCTDKFQLINNDYKIYYSRDLFIYKKKTYISISYYIYYLYNGAIGCGYNLFPNNKFLGFHENDIERVKILIDIETNIPKFVYFSAHKNEGKWFDWDKCEKNEDGNLKVFIARSSHANYNESGTWYRIFFLANDHCSKSGKKIIPELVYSKFEFNPPEFQINSPFKKRILICKE